MTRKIRLAVLGFVFINLAVSTVHALPFGRQVSPQAESVLAMAWEWFGSHVLAHPRPEESGAKAGSSMDPDGLFAGQGGEAGSQMDPDGHQ